MDFLPPKHVRTQMLKFEPRAVAGISLGYHMQPGGRWRGEYKVATLDSLTKRESGGSVRASIFTVREVVFDPKKPIDFPLARIRDLSKQSTKPMPAPSVGTVDIEHRGVRAEGSYGW